MIVVWLIITQIEKEAASNLACVAINQSILRCVKLKLKLVEKNRMAGEGESSVSVGVGEESASGASSPKNKVKFLCSHGGKVLPRPSDGLLKYVGGETRVISVPRTVTFSELMKKLGAMIEGGENMVLKYQLVAEDLDTLVSIRNDEDIKHMIEEHDRHESGGAPLLRAFLFPSNLQVQAAGGAAVIEPYAALEQRYIDAINGIMRTSPRASWLSPIRAFYTSSACSSPKSNSPDGHTASSDLVLPESSPSSLFHAPPPPSSRHPMMHRVRSSPSISSLGNLHGLTTTTTNTVQQQYDHHNHNHNHYHNHSQSQSHHQHPPPLSGYATPSRTLVPLDPQLGGGGGFGMGRPHQMMSLAKTDSSSSRGGGGGNTHYYTSSNRPPKGYAYYDDSAGYGGGSNVVMVERVNSMPHSPRKSSIWA